MILGMFHSFHIFLKLTLHWHKTLFSIFWCFRDPNDVQMTWKFTSISFMKEEDLGAKEANERRPKRGWPTWPDSLAAWGPPSGASWLLCRRSFLPRLRLDLKPTIKIAPRRRSRGGGRKRRNHETETWTCRSKGENSVGALPAWSPSPPTMSPPSPWWRGSSPPLEVTYVSLLSLELH